MPSLQSLYSALKQADADNNAEDAKIIVGMIKREEQNSRVNQEPDTEVATEAIAPVETTSGFTGALESSYERLKGEAALVAGKTGLMDIGEAEKYQKEQQAKASQFKGTEEGWTEAPVTKFKELLGGSLPYMAAPLAVGAGVALGAPVAKVAGIGAGTLAAFGVGTAQFTGSNLARKMETGESLEDASLLEAGAAAVPQAFLDTLSFKMMPGIRRLLGSAGIDLTEKSAAELAKRGILSTVGGYAAQGAKTAGIEGTTEAAQQFFERLQAGLQLNDVEARREYYESFLGGAILGGVIGGAGRAVEKLTASPVVQPPPPPPEAPQIDPDKYGAVIKQLTEAIPDSGLTDSSKLGEIFKASGIENEAEVSAYLNQAIASGEIAANSNPVFNVSDANGKVLFSTVEKAVADKAAERLNAEDAGTATVAEATATKFTKPTGLPQGIEVRQGQFKQDMFNISRGDTILNPEPLSAEEVGQKAYRLSKITAGSTEANTKEIEVLQKKIDTNNTSKEKLEAAGEALSPEYATLSAQVDENNALIQAQIDEVKQKGSAFSGEISITPAKQSDEGFTLFKQGKPAEYFETEEDLNQALAAEPTIAGPTIAGTTAAGQPLRGQPAGTTAAGTTAAGTTAAGTTSVPSQEALAEARESLRQNLLPFMKKVGLESTGLRIMDSIENGQGESDGRYTKQLIDISLKAANPMGTLRHETIHALKELGAFSKQEWSLLESYAKKQWINQFLRQRKIGDSNYYDTYKKIYLEDNPSIAGFDEYIIEEAIADAFKYFSATKPPANIIGNIYRKVKALLEGMGNQLSGLGFQTADDVFKRVEAGQMKPTQQAGTGAAPRYSYVKIQLGPDKSIEKDNPRGYKIDKIDPSDSWTGKAVYKRCRFFSGLRAV
jgi:hypothetical protein